MADLIVNGGKALSRHDPPVRQQERRAADLLRHAADGRSGRPGQRPGHHRPGKTGRLSAGAGLAHRLGPRRRHHASGTRRLPRLPRAGRAAPGHALVRAALSRPSCIACGASPSAPTPRAARSGCARSIRIWRCCARSGRGWPTGNPWSSTLPDGFQGRAPLARLHVGHRHRELRDGGGPGRRAAPRSSTRPASRTCRTCAARWSRWGPGSRGSGPAGWRSPAWPGSTAPRIAIDTDYHEVVTFLALGAITGGEVRVEDSVPRHFDLIARAFGKLGVVIDHEGDTARVAGAAAPGDRAAADAATCCRRSRPPRGPTSPSTCCP